MDVCVCVCVCVFVCVCACVNMNMYMYMSVCDAWGTSRSAGTPVRVHVPAGDLHTSVSLVAAGRVGGERAIVTGERARGLSSVLWRNVR